jgi:tRNA/rRNA methyltransferase
VFGNETSGLRRLDIDRCDLVVRIPTIPEFPVLNLAQAVAIMLGYLGEQLATSESDGPPPAPQASVEEMMDHLRRSLFAVGFLDPSSPDRILRKLRRLFGRAGVTENEVAIIRGMCRQMEWAARTGPLRRSRGDVAD